MNRRGWSALARLLVTSLNVVAFYFVVRAGFLTKKAFADADIIPAVDPMPLLPNEEAEAVALVLMGVSGAGKTTIGQLLASDLGWPFFDADDLHPESNRSKMAAGHPLDDADRWPWLRRVRQQIEDHLRRGTSSVVACSALKAAYREILIQGLEGVRVVYLRGDAALIAARLQAREGHFMPPELLASQFEALEEPADDTWVVDVSEQPPAIVARIRARLES